MTFNLDKSIIKLKILQYTLLLNEKKEKLASILIKCYLKHLETKYFTKIYINS